LQNDPARLPTPTAVCSSAVLRARGRHLRNGKAGVSRGGGARGNAVQAWAIGLPTRGEHWCLGLVRRGAITRDGGGAAGLRIVRRLQRHRQRLSAEGEPCDLGECGHCIPRVAARDQHRGTGKVAGACARLPMAQSSRSAARAPRADPEPPFSEALAAHRSPRPAHRYSGLKLKGRGFLQRDGHYSN
jgi:hypothetical protein